MSDERKNLQKVTYVGTVGQLIEKKNGWYAIEVMVPGKQYPIKADTKLENLIGKAREVRDSGAVATFTVEEWDSDNISPKTSKPYTERRMSSIEEGSHAPAGGTGAGGGADVTAHHEPVADADRQRLISRQTCLKAACELYSGPAVGGSTDPALDVMRVAQRFESWLYRDIDEVPSNGGSQAAVPQIAPQVDEEEVERLREKYSEGEIPSDQIPY